MKKKLIGRGLIGFPVGIAIGYVITVLVSIRIGDGFFYPVFAIACVIMFPISYFANWMPHSTGGILSYVGIFVAIFLAAWVTQYSVWKRKIKKMNEGIKDN